MMNRLRLHSTETRQSYHQVAMRCELNSLDPKNGASIHSLRVEADLRLERGVDARFLRSKVQSRQQKLACPVRHELWKKTCFEVFVPFDDGSYFELHLSADGECAGYRLSHYRAPLVPLDGLFATSHWDLGAQESEFHFQGVLNLPQSLIGARSLTGRFGLSAVIEPAWVFGPEQTSKLYPELSGDRLDQVFLWALQQSAEKPDFHNSSDWIGR